MRILDVFQTSVEGMFQTTIQVRNRNYCVIAITNTCIGKVSSMKVEFYGFKETIKYAGISSRDGGWHERPTFATVMDNSPIQSGIITLDDIKCAMELPWRVSSELETLVNADWQQIC